MSRRIDRTGEIATNNYGSEMRIDVYRNCMDMDVYFPEYDWTARHVRYKKFEEGEIRCPYERRTYGVGYMGDGQYDSRENGRLSKCYVAWSGMLERCYSQSYHERKPTYIGCTVCDEWHNFQNFAEWYYEHYYEIEGKRTDLDKDILVKGNKEYSPYTCVFVPQEINLLFTKSNAVRGEYPVGVYYHQEKRKYVAQCNTLGKKKWIGNYDNKTDAFVAYKDFKEAYIKKVANDYMEDIPYVLYEAMMNYSVEWDD